MPVAEHHRPEHDFLGELLGFRFDHQHRVGGACHHEIEPALRHFVDLRIEHVFVVDEADARRPDRAHERSARQSERGRRGDHGQDVGIVLHVMGQRGDDHLRVAAIALGKQRADRTVDQARNQGFLLGRPAFALEVTAGDAAGGEELFLIIDGQRQEIESGFWLPGRHHGGDDGALAIAGDDGAVGLARDLAGLEGELAPAPIEFNTIDIEHVPCLSWFSNRNESHEQDGEMLWRMSGVRQHPAILPWRSSLSDANGPCIGARFFPAAPAAGRTAARYASASQMRGIRAAISGGY